MKAVENRHFMLSDLFDYIHLVRRWAAPGSARAVVHFIGS